MATKSEAPPEDDGAAWLDQFRATNRPDGREELADTLNKLFETDTRPEG